MISPFRGSVFNLSVKLSPLVICNSDFILKFVSLVIVAKSKIYPKKTKIILSNRIRFDDNFKSSSKKIVNN